MCFSQQLFCYLFDFRVFFWHLEPVAEDFVVGLVVRGVRHELVSVTAVVTLQCSKALVVRGRARGSHSREVEGLLDVKRNLEELAHRVNVAGIVRIPTLVIGRFFEEIAIH